ncbi:chaplin [Streptomyces sp. NPDC096205]|uniref:chaplin n=1 Tax=Streptomyces sp. NPDC096205 TaxID=3366081 RepID=UPI00381EC1EA
MRQATRKGLLTMAAATGVIAAAGGAAHAASGASGSASNSPGVLSGNSVQAPVSAPVNVCGNTVDVVGALNPAMGNSCTNNSGTSGDSGGYGDSGDSGGYGDSSGSGDTGATGSTSDSPGVASGNHVQAPVEAPVNVCGNTVDVVGALNPAMGNDCGSDHGSRPGPPDDDDGYGTPPGPGKPGVPEDRNIPPAPPSPDHRPPAAPHDDSSVHGHRAPGADRSVSHPAAHTGGTELASTGIDLPVGAAGALGAGAVLGGAVLYRRARRSA